jgi:hypothetical protein
VTAVVIEPESATLNPGQSIAFTTWQAVAGGGLGPATAELAAEGGSITRAGMYTAGNVPGAYSVIARLAQFNLADTATVTVLAVAPVTAASVTITPGTAAIVPGESVQLVAIVRDAVGQVLTGRPVTWRLSGAAARLSSSGLVTGVADGVALVQAESEGRIGSATVSVVPVSGVPPDILGEASFETGWDGFGDGGAGTPGALRVQGDAREGSWAVLCEWTGADVLRYGNLHRFNFGPAGNSGYDEWYFRAWVKFQGQGPSEVLKFIRFGQVSAAGSLGGLFLDQQGIWWGFDVEELGAAEPIGLFLGTAPAAFPGRVYAERLANDGQWHLLEVRYERNPQGATQLPPRATFWFDGVALVQPDLNDWNGATRVARGRASSARLGHLMIAVTLNSPNRTAGSFLIDRIAISSRRIGP